MHDGGGGRVIEVRCVDYGDVECVKEVWELDHQNLTLPAQASVRIQLGYMSPSVVVAGFLL